MKRVVVGLVWVLGLVWVGVGIAADEPGQSAMGPEYYEADKLRDAGEPAAAIPLAEKALARAEKRDPESRAVIICLTLLADCHGALEHYGDVVRLTSRAVAIMRTHPDRAGLLRISLARLARAYHYLGRYAEAEPSYAEEIDLLERARPWKPHEMRAYFDDSFSLAAVRAEREHRLEAARTLGKILSAFREIPPESSRLARRVVIGAQTRLADLRRPTWTDSLMVKDLGIAEQRFSDDQVVLAFSRGLLGVNRAVLGRNAEAERLLRQALAGLEREYGPKHAEVLATYEIIELFYRRTDRVEVADAIVKRTGIKPSPRE